MNKHLAAYRQSFLTGLETYTRPWALALLYLGFCAGLPYLLIFSTMSLWLQEAGVDRAAITLFSWAALGYSFKFLWAPLIDALPLPVLTARLGRRKSWLVFTQLCVALAIFWASCVEPAAGEVRWMACAAVALGFAAASQDIVIDAYRIERAPDDSARQSVMAASYTAGYRLGMIASGAGALWLAQGLGSTAEHYSYRAWQLTYLVMAGVMFVCVCCSLALQEPQGQKSAGEKSGSAGENARLFAVFLLAVAAFAGAYLLAGAALPHIESRLVNFALGAVRLVCALAAAGCAGWAAVALRLAPKEAVSRLWVQPLADFFARCGRAAVLLLALIGLYRISDIVAGTVQNLFYADMGFSKDEIASVTKVFAVVMTLAGGFVGGLAAQRLPVMRMMMIGALASSLTNILFSVLAQLGHSLPFLYFTVALDFLAGGFAATAFVAFLSSLTSIRFTAAQYALFSSLMTLIPKLLGGYSGALTVEYGYSRFFIGTACIGLPILLLIWLAEKRLPLNKDKT